MLLYRRGVVKPTAAMTSVAKLLTMTNCSTDKSGNDTQLQAAQAYLNSF